MDGTEQILFESTEIGEYAGYIFLHEMVSGDIVIIKAYIKNVENEVYGLRDSATFEGAQGAPCVGVHPTIGKVGLKITAQQTAGTFRTIHHMWFKR